MLHKIKVWDLPTRLFHWTLVILFIGMAFSGMTGRLNIHLPAGLLMLTLIVTRIIWGFVGSSTSRFSNFVKGPRQIRRYLKNEITENEQPGHNPLGALMVIALIGGVLLQVITGLFAKDMNSYTFNGYLNKFVSDEAGEMFLYAHIVIFWLLVAAAVVHILTVVLYKVVKKNNLIIPMITGYKRISDPLPRIEIKSTVLFFVIFLIVGALAYCIYKFV